MLCLCKTFEIFVSEQVTEWGPYTYKVIRQREEISDEDEGKERIRFAMRGTYRYIPGITCSPSLCRVESGMDAPDRGQAPSVGIGSVVNAPIHQDP